MTYAPTAETYINNALNTVRDDEGTAGELYPIALDRLNQALHEISGMTNWECLERETTVNTVINQRGYDMPAAFQDAVAVVPTATDYGIDFLEAMPLSRAYKTYTENETGKPFNYTRGLHDFSDTSEHPQIKLSFFPLPNAVYTFKIIYVKSFDEVVESTKTQVIPVPDYMVGLIQALLNLKLLEFDEASKQAIASASNTFIRALNTALERNRPKNNTATSFRINPEQARYRRQRGRRQL